MNACPTCGGTTLYRKSDIAFDVGMAGRFAVKKTPSTKYLRCTLDVCGDCGRTVMYVQNPQEWLERVGFDEMIDTSDPASG